MRDPVLLLNPNEYLTFTGRILEGNIITSLTLKNPANGSILFKVKTTKPDRYCVSPAHGTLDADGEVRLTIKLKESGVPPEELTKDKFLVQSILSEFVAKGVSVEEAFRRIKNADLMQQKLKVMAEAGNQEFLPVDDERHSKSFKSAKVTGSQQGSDLSYKGSSRNSFKGSNRGSQGSQTGPEVTQERRGTHESGGMQAPGEMQESGGIQASEGMQSPTVIQQAGSFEELKSPTGMQGSGGMAGSRGMPELGEIQQHSRSSGESKKLVATPALGGILEESREMQKSLSSGELKKSLSSGELKQPEKKISGEMKKNENFLNIISGSRSSQVEATQTNIVSFDILHKASENPSDMQNPMNGENRMFKTKTSLNAMASRDERHPNEIISSDTPEGQVVIFEEGHRQEDAINTSEESESGLPRCDTSENRTDSCQKMKDEAEKAVEPSVAHVTQVSTDDSTDAGNCVTKVDKAGSSCFGNADSGSGHNRCIVMAVIIGLVCVLLGQILQVFMCSICDQRKAACGM